MDKTKTAPGVGSTESGKENDFKTDHFSPTHDDNTHGAAGQGQISALLGHGREAAVTAAALAELLGTPRRAVTLQVERERRHGIPVLADSNGYFLPSCEAETERFLRSLRHRALEILRTAAAIDKAGGRN